MQGYSLWFFVFDLLALFWWAGAICRSRLAGLLCSVRLSSCMLLLLCRWCADQGGAAPSAEPELPPSCRAGAGVFAGGLLGLGLWASQAQVLWALLRASEQVLKGKALGLWLSGPSARWGVRAELCCG